MKAFKKKEVKGVEEPLIADEEGSGPVNADAPFEGRHDW